MATKRKPKKGRIAYPSVSDSMRVARLGVTGALLWLILITHADDQGRLPGGALRERLVPHFGGISVGDVDGALEAMERERLVTRYRSPMWGALVQIRDWWKWQGGLTYKRPSMYDPPDGWRDRVTARLAAGPYVQRMGDGLDAICIACWENVIPRAHGRGWVCPNCDAELLGTRSPRPKVGGVQTRVTGRARELTLAALATGPLTKPQLAAATGYSVGTIGNTLPGLQRAGEVVRIRRKRPWTYRLKGSP